MNDSIMSYQIQHRYLEKNNIEFKIIKKLRIKRNPLKCWSSYEIATCHLIYLSLTFLFGDERLNPNAPLQCPIHPGKQHTSFRLSTADCRLPTAGRLHPSSHSLRRLSWPSELRASHRFDFSFFRTIFESWIFDLLTRTLP